MTEGAKEIEFIRKPDQQLSDPEFLESLTGKYTLEDGTELAVSLRGAKTLWVSACPDSLITSLFHTAR